MIPTTPRLNNCLIGAWWLKRRFGGTLRGLRTREGGPRHWICLLDNGETWHFRKIRYILPWPLKYTLFVGKYERLDNRDRNRSQAA